MEKSKHGSVVRRVKIDEKSLNEMANLRDKHTSIPNVVIYAYTQRHSAWARVKVGRNLAAYRLNYHPPTLLPPEPPPE